MLPSLLAEKCHYIEVNGSQVCFARSPEQLVFIFLVVWVYLFRIMFHILIPLSYYYQDFKVHSSLKGRTFYIMLLYSDYISGKMVLKRE